MSVNKRKGGKVCMKTNEGERLVRKTHPPSCFECNGPSPPPCIRPSFGTGSSVGNATSTCVITSLLAFTSIRRAGQRASGNTLLACAAPVHIIIMERNSSQRDELGQCDFCPFVRQGLSRLWLAIHCFVVRRLKTKKASRRVSYLCSYRCKINISVSKPNTFTATNMIYS